MPAVVACPKCKAKFNLPDHLLGKPVQCNACNARFQVGQPKTGLAIKPAGGAVVARSKTLSPEQQAEMNRLGVQGPLKSRPDLFGSGPISPADPLANHVVEDPGFTDEPEDLAGNESAEQPQSDEFSSMFDNPAIAAPRKTKSKVDPLAQYLTSDSDDELNPVQVTKKPSEKTLWIKMALIIPPYLVAFILSFFTRDVSLVAFWISYAISVIVNVGLMIEGAKLVRKNTGSMGLAVVAFFIPIFLLVFSVIYWNKQHPMKWFIAAWISLTVAAAIGGALFGVALAINLPGVFASPS